MVHKCMIVLVKAPFTVCQPTLCHQHVDLDNVAGDNEDILREEEIMYTQYS